LWPPEGLTSLRIVEHRPGPVKLNVSIMSIKDCYQGGCL
jgi:hypothetical protein